MKLVIAQMKHETNTYSPVPTPLARFAVGGGTPPEGEAARAAYLGTGSAIAAFIDLAEQAGAEFAIPIAAAAWPSGPVRRRRVRAHRRRASATRWPTVATACCSTCTARWSRESHDDGEGELLRRIRAVAPDVPIGVALDMHTNLYDDCARDATVIAGYQTYPHVDMYETGLRAGRALLALLAGRARPAMAWGRRPMLPHVMRQGTDDSPNRELQARCREMEAARRAVRERVRRLSERRHRIRRPVGGGRHRRRPGARARAGATSCSTWRGDAREVRLRGRAARRIDGARAALADAKPAGSGPVVLLDHSDNCASGGTMDTMTVLGAILDAGLEDVAAFAVFDPAAVQQMIAAGVGAEVTLPLGGKLDMPAIGLEGRSRAR